MKGETGYIYDVNEQQFEEKVIKASGKTIVIVDFWADWCAPCKMLGPVLERVVQSFSGKVSLAKVNVDENQELSMHFGIRSIPTVKVFKDGTVAGEFMGALPEHEIIAILQPIIGDEMQDNIEHSFQLVEKGNIRKAESLLKSILDKNPNHPGALLGLARCAIKTGKIERARKFLATITESHNEYSEAQALLSVADFIDICERSGGLGKNKKQVSQHPEDLNMLYTLGCCYVANNLYREAFETFLSIIKKDKHYDDRKAKNAVITLFTLAGQENELTREYRDRLARELF
jgi:putative thioredoxin